MQNLSMPISTQSNFNSSKWQDLDCPQLLDEAHLENIKNHLDLIFLALKAIAELNHEAILSTAQELNLAAKVSYYFKSWELKAVDSQDESSRNHPRFDVEIARSLVLIICYLAHQYRELLRRSVSLLEQVTEQNTPPEQTSLLGNYLDKFINSYQEKINSSSNFSIQVLSQLAWKILISLLFYSNQNSHCLLWVAILDASQTSQE